MSYSIIGPFDIEEGLALSAANPKECIEHGWGHMTYLESAGSKGLALGGFDDLKRCSSKHGGSDISTILYYDVPVVLCQIDYRQKSNFLKGFYICSSDVTENFLGGLERLIDIKSDSNSELNINMNEAREELKQRIESLPNLEPRVKQSIVNSGILEPSHIYKDELESARGKIFAKNVDERGLLDFIYEFYNKDMSDRNRHICHALYHLGIPIDDDIKEAAIKETLDSLSGIYSDDEDGRRRFKMLEESFKSDPEKFVFR